MGSLLSQQVQPLTPAPMVGTGTQSQFFQALFGTGLGMNTDNFGYINGVPGYGGPLSTDPNSTLMSGVAGNWSPQNAGTDYLTQWLAQGGGKADPSMSTAQSNMSQYGGIGGYPTELMHSMAQFGGTGGPGHNAMTNLLNYGMPSAAGQGVKDMSEKGYTGSWGDQLQKRASGSGDSAAAKMLAPFLTSRAYQSNWGGK